jgi:hypothetical protein
VLELVPELPAFDRVVSSVLIIVGSDVGGLVNEIVSEVEVSTGTTILPVVVLLFSTFPPVDVDPSTAAAAVVALRAARLAFFFLFFPFLNPLNPSTLESKWLM